ncbi:hypothetical protein KIH87_05425 [Paraneptunicella aestuarii]|uniref:DUF4062 domain-containing protein n=1 Tax=Paraneptunicella aestuarii TaxID=2831148 RepID=UPI001E2E6E9D|nr:DUF4062 domain-containing protein [Paraneptunicella aestuarii]UAA39798.1 hypothetical protein KIH87_05425 [Paraneptunicella aestuarii]
MSYSAQVFRILIASPSDVSQERDIAVKTIQEWNDLNSSERQIVLLPLRWETHSAPEYGKRPQEIINRQVVDQCDLLVGVFWTRIGSPTGVADSGTLEEIERVAKDGKPVMLYFSKANQNPDDIDLDQLKRLREFKSKTFPKALVENYSSQVEFRDKLSKQLEIQIRGLLAEKGIKEESDMTSPITDIQLHFSDPSTGADLGEEIDLTGTYIEVTDYDDIPDYEEEQEVKRSRSRSSLSHMIISSRHRDKDYYRDRVRRFVDNNFRSRIRFWLKNVGTIGARDVYIDLKVKSSGSGLTIFSDRQIEDENGNVFILPSGDSELEVTKVDSGIWSSAIEMRALQPKREVSPNKKISLGAKESCEISVEANIYADTLPEPISKTLKINYELKLVEASYREILEELSKE